MHKKLRFGSVFVFPRPTKIGIMSHYTDKNERLNRQTAFVLALSLHVALATALYFQISEKPAVTKGATAQTEQHRVTPTIPKTVPVP